MEESSKSNAPQGNPDARTNFTCQKHFVEGLKNTTASNKHFEMKGRTKWVLFTKSLKIYFSDMLPVLKQLSFRFDSLSRHSASSSYNKFSIRLVDELFFSSYILIKNLSYNIEFVRYSSIFEKFQKLRVIRRVNWSFPKTNKQSNIISISRMNV